MIYPTTPLKPMKAIAKRPAVSSAIGVPCIAFGTLLSANCSRIPAKRTSANAKPSAVAKAKSVPESNPYSAPAGRLASSFFSSATMMATPRIQQLVVISGRKTPRA